MAKKIDSASKVLKALNEEIIDLDQQSYNALDLFNLKIKNVPKLLDPFLQTVGLASLVGTSDSGKSTILRQLCLAIALKQKTFLTFPLNIKYGKALYVSTEDDPTSVGASIRKQIEAIEKDNNKLNKDYLKNLEFIFDTHQLVENLDKRLLKDKHDLIVIDAFADVFTKELNANTQVRQFLNDYDKLAKKHETLIIFLHHIGKKTMNYDPSKNSIIGSQAFEAKMRVVLELRPNLNSKDLKDLWILKGNFLSSDYKAKSYILKFDEDLLLFSNTGNRGSTQSSKVNNPEIIKKVLELSSKKLSTREIDNKLRGTNYAIGKSSIALIIKANK